MATERLEDRWSKLWGASPTDPTEIPPPDFMGFQLNLVQMVEQGVVQLVKIDDAHVYELVQDTEKRKARERAAAAVAAKLSGIRSSVEGVYGKDASVKLFAKVTQMPTTPRAIHRVGTRVRDQLRDKSFVLSQEKLEGWDDPDRESLAAALDRPLNLLGAALAGIDIEVKDSKRSLLLKTRAVEETGRTIRGAAGCLASLYRLAGFDELADQILPRRRRRGAAANGDEEPTDPPVDPDPQPAEDAAPSDDGEPSGSQPSGPIGIVS